LKRTTPAPGTSPIKTLIVSRRDQARGETALPSTRSKAYDAAPSQLPRSIEKGASTVGGRAKVRRGTYSLSSGWFEPRDAGGGGNGFHWITDHHFAW
jgi:hypothetical protein